MVVSGGHQFTVFSLVLMMVVATLSISYGLAGLPSDVLYDNPSVNYDPCYNINQPDQICFPPDDQEYQDHTGSPPGYHPDDQDHTSTGKPVSNTTKPNTVDKYYQCICSSVKQKLNHSVPCDEIEKKEREGTFFGAVDSLEILENSGLPFNDSLTFSKLATIRVQCTSVYVTELILSCWCDKIKREFGRDLPCSEMMEDPSSPKLEETIKKHGIDMDKPYIRAEVVLLMTQCSLPSFLKY